MDQRSPWGTSGPARTLSDVGLAHPSGSGHFKRRDQHARAEPELDGARQTMFKHPRFGADSPNFSRHSRTLSDSAASDCGARAGSAPRASSPPPHHDDDPAAWDGIIRCPTTKRRFLRIQGLLRKPWDGPALSLNRRDGHRRGCSDRNGRGPRVTTVTKEGFVVMESETGCHRDAPAKRALEGRLKTREDV